jgi:hypothetical protein
LLHGECEDDRVWYISDHGADKQRKHTEHSLRLLHLRHTAKWPGSFFAMVNASFIEESGEMHRIIVYERKYQKQGNAPYTTSNVQMKNVKCFC